MAKQKQKVSDLKADEQSLKLEVEQLNFSNTKIKQEIKINCTYTDLVLLSDLMPTQGELKVSKGESLEKLEGSFDKHGFIKPIVLWHNTKSDSKTLEMLDGHQRRKLLLRLAVQGKGTKGFYIPVIYSKAPTKEAAMQILLHLVEQTGDITQSGLTAFAEKNKMSLDDIARTMSLKSPALALAQKKAQEKFTTELQAQPKYPIQPNFAEHYSSITIFCTNEMDKVWLDNFLKLPKTIDQNSEYVAPAKVVTVEMFRTIIEERENQLTKTKPDEDASK